MVLPSHSEQQEQVDCGTVLKLCAMVALLMFGGWLWLIAWVRSSVPWEQSINQGGVTAERDHIVESLPESVQR